MTEPEWIGAERPGMRRVAHVLLDSALPQLDHLFDYAVPDDLAGALRVGQRVRVPFRSENRRSHGYIVGFAEHSDFGGELQPIAEIVGPVPVLTPEVYRLARAVADRAGGSAGDILRLAIPPRMVRVEKRHLAAASAARADAGATEETPGHADTEPSEQHSQPPGEDAPLSGDAAFGPSIAEYELAERLIRGGRLAVTASHGPERLTTGEWVGGWAVRLARAAIAVHAQGRSAIVVAPDYRDIDQIIDAIEALGHSGLVRVDSRQSGSERYASFLRALDPEPRIILGNRSAVYAPAYRLGAVLMWDDGDPVLAEHLTPYVHARDAALVRAEQSGAGLYFQAHSRSAEVQRLVDLGYVQTELLPPRRTRVVAAEAVRTRESFAGRVPEFAAQAIREGLRTGPVLVQVATPGYAPIAVCTDCGDLARCGHCRGPLGFRSGAVHGGCRWCGQQAVGWRCPTCRGTRLEMRGAGSERTAEQFERQFEGARIVLSDGEHPHERVDSRPAVIVATRGAEPIAAGGYRVVVLLDAERLLGIESLRAGEDCLRWWSNAASFAAPDGVCVVASGGGPVVHAFVTGRTEEWLRAELRDRHALRYPPAVRVASVTGGRTEVERALDALGELGGVDVLGPAPWSATRPGDPGDAPGVSLVRAIVRFEYGQGTEVAKRLRGALVSDAAGSSSRVAGRRPGRARPEALRLRFDDRGVFDA